MLAGLRGEDETMSESEDTVVLQDHPSYDVMYIRAGAAMVVTILAPVFFLLAYSEPALTPLSVILVILIHLLVIGAPYIFGVPGRVIVSKGGAKVSHGMVTINMPADEIHHLEIRNPPWWLSVWYLFPEAQWVLLRKREGLLKWWYFPTTNAVKFIEAVKSIMR